MVFVVEVDPGGIPVFRINDSSRGCDDDRMVFEVRQVDCYVTFLLLCVEMEDADVDSVL